EAFEVSLGEVESFAPVTPTVFIRVVNSAHRLQQLHDRFDTQGLACDEEWPYMPHLTIAKLGNQDQAQQAYLTARDRWARYRGDRVVAVKELTFVREEDQNRWVDLAGLPLGRSLVKH